MKNYLLGICCLFSSTLWGQAIYAPVFINPCSGEEEEVTWFMGDSLGNTYSAEENDFESTTLPQTGKYQLYYNYPKSGVTIELQEQGVHRDTLFLEQLELVKQTSTPPYGAAYYLCDSLAEGFVATYYYNKNKRVRGTFAKGQPVDSTFFYYRNGQLKRLFIPSEGLGIRMDFYEHGQLKHHYDYDQRILKDYYPNGQLESSSESTKRGHPLLTRYYPNGQLKSKEDDKSCKRYNSKGTLVEKINSKVSKPKKRTAFYKKHTPELSYSYQWDSYDSTQTLTRTVKFEVESFALLPLPYHLKQVATRQLEEILLYKEGKPAYKVTFLYISKAHQGFRKQLFLYKKEGKEWIQQQTAPVEEVYELLESLK